MDEARTKLESSIGFLRRGKVCNRVAREEERHGFGVWRVVVNVICREDIDVNRDGMCRLGLHIPLQRALHDVPDVALLTDTFTADLRPAIYVVRRDLTNQCRPGLSITKS